MLPEENHTAHAVWLTDHMHRPPAWITCTDHMHISHAQISCSDYITHLLLLQDIFGIYLFTFVINFALYIPTTTTHPKSSDLRFSPEFRFLDTVVMSMPACVPAVIIFAIVVGLQRLRWRGIIALYPGQLKLAAAVDIACFDKTGTLTGSEVWCLWCRCWKIA